MNACLVYLQRSRVCAHGCGETLLCDKTQGTIDVLYLSKCSFLSFSFKLHIRKCHWLRTISLLQLSLIDSNTVARYWQVSTLVRLFFDLEIVSSLLSLPFRSLSRINSFICFHCLTSLKCLAFVSAFRTLTCYTHTHAKRQMSKNSKKEKKKQNAFKWQTTALYVNKKWEI